MGAVMPKGPLDALRAYADANPCPICGSKLEVPEGNSQLFCTRTKWPVLRATRAALTVAYSQEGE